MSHRYVAFIRHGDYHQTPDVPSAHQPYDLTDAGIAQASDAAMEIEALLVHLQATLDPVLDCSPLLRAWRTADIMARELSGACAVESFDDLTERCVGSAANLTSTEITKIIENDPRFEAPPADWKSNSYYCLPFPGAESLMAAGERLARHVNRRVSGEKADNAILKLIVGHGAAFRHAAYQMGVLKFEDIKRLSMFHARPVVLLRQSGGWKHVTGDWKVRKGDVVPMD